MNRLLRLTTAVLLYLLFQTISVQAQLTGIALDVDGPPLAVAGTPVSYTFTVRNYGPGTATSVRFTLIAGAGEGGVFGGCDVGSVAPVCNLGSIAPDASRQFTFGFTSRSEMAEGGLLVVGGELVADGVFPDDIGSGFFTQYTRVSDMSITKSGPSIVNSGSVITWTLTASNIGPSDAFAVDITDTLPAGLGTPSWTGCLFSENELCEIGPLAAGKTATVQLSVPTNPANASMQFTNVATIRSPSSDPVAANNTSNAVTTTLLPTIPVPAVSEWGLLLLGLTLAMAGAMSLRR